MRRGSVRVVLFVTALVTAWHPAGAQTTTEPSPLVWDVTVAAGLFSGHPDGAAPEVRHDSWYHEPAASIAIGRYWTTHLKTQLEVFHSGEGHRFVSHVVTVEGVPWPVPIAATERRQVTSLSAGALWQLFDNQWVHPFIEGGLSVDRERLQTDRPRQEIWVGRSAQDPGRSVEVAAESHTGPATTNRVRGFVGAGAKLYVTERTFVRLEMRATGVRRVHSMTYRLGVGVDF